MAAYYVQRTGLATSIMSPLILMKTLMEGEVRLILQWLFGAGRGFLSEDLTFEWRPEQCEVRYINR